MQWTITQPHVLVSSVYFSIIFSHFFLFRLCCAPSFVSIRISLRFHCKLLIFFSFFFAFSKLVEADNENLSNARARISTEWIMHACIINITLKTKLSERNNCVSSKKRLLSVSFDFLFTGSHHIVSVFRLLFSMFECDTLKWWIVAASNGWIGVLMGHAHCLRWCQWYRQRRRSHANLVAFPSLMPMSWLMLFDFECFSVWFSANRIPHKRRRSWNNNDIASNQNLCASIARPYNLNDNYENCVL